MIANTKDATASFKLEKIKSELINIDEKKVLCYRKKINYNNKEIDMHIILLLIAVAPVIALETVTYLLDRWEKEPMLLLMKIYFLGALTVISVYLIQKIILGFNVFEDILSVVIVAFVVAGLVKEYAKRAVLMNVAYENDNFNERIDGVVYSVFTALGFATVENIM